jgi:hypothetical protein
MISIFRKIRQQFLYQNKFSRYLLYAIGEILLVVIGILIALQVNTWSNEKQDREKELYYLNSVKKSIELSQNELKRVIDDAALISSSADTLFSLLAHQRYEKLNGEYLDSLLLTASDYSLISLNDGGVQEILNTGALDIIRDEEIRVSLASWDERIHKIRKHEEDSEFISRNYNAYLDDFIDVSLWEVDPRAGSIIPERKQELLTDPRLRNFLNHIYFVHRGMHRRYTEEKAYLDSLVVRIDEYLVN